MNEIVVFVTTPSREVARAIGRAMVEQELAACANLLPPIESIYTWKGEIHQEEEVMMIMKTRADLFEQLADAVKSVHPYDVPEVIAVSITHGSPEYLQWIADVTK